MTVTEKPVAPSDVRKAIRLFRNAVNQIRLLQRSAIPRWSDGLTAWFVEERSPEDSEEFLEYDDDELHSYRQARDMLLRSVELNPYFPDAFILLGNACQEIEGDSAAMLEYYDMAIELDPDNDEFYNCRMSHHLNTGDLVAALIDLEHLERLQSRYASSMREHYEKAKIGG